MSDLILQSGCPDTELGPMGEEFLAEALRKKLKVDCFCKQSVSYRGLAVHLRKNKECRAVRTESWYASRGYTPNFGSRWADQDYYATLERAGIKSFDGDSLKYGRGTRRSRVQRVVYVAQWASSTFYRFQDAGADMVLWLLQNAEARAAANVIYSIWESGPWRLGYDSCVTEAVTDLYRLSGVG